MRKLFILCWIVALAGCAGQAQVSNPMFVGDVEYDALWQASIDVLSEDFDIPYMDRDEGAVHTGMKRSGSIIDFWNSDASSLEDVIRETFYLTRRYVALNFKKEGGGTLVEAKVFRQRNVSDNYPVEHATEPYAFSPREADYYPRDSNLFPEQEDAYVVQSSVWLGDGRDADYEERLISRILKRARK